MEDDRAVPVRELILVPSLITLAITIVRLVGELQNWAPGLFGKEAGGGGALVGISWLVPIFGGYFALRLMRSGHGPANLWVSLGSVVGALALVMATGFIGGALKLPPLWSFLAIAAASLVAVWIAGRGWPALGRTLLAYALAARIPVTIVMLIAIYGNWGTHYDVAPPNATVVDTWNPFLKWLAIEALPQLTLWIGFTVVVGGLFGVIAAAAARRLRPATA